MNPYCLVQSSQQALQMDNLQQKFEKGQERFRSIQTTAKAQRAEIADLKEQLATTSADLESAKASEGQVSADQQAATDVRQSHSWMQNTIADPIPLSQTRLA